MSRVLFAPMEGLTDAVFRRVHFECFGGVEKYFIPFISPTMHLVLTGREKHNVLPEYNRAAPCVPQVLTRDPEHFLWAARMLADFGYDEINLNAGCPSGTVTAKGKGAGMLRDPDELDDFLDSVCAKSPLPISVKTRIGFHTAQEWERLLAVYAQYPLRRMIVHPRTCKERYDPGTVHAECWKMLANIDTSRWQELVFNGDLFSPAQVSALETGDPPRPDALMLGRGLVAQPAMARVLNGGAPLTTPELVRFHDQLVRELRDMYDANITFMKLRVVMKHIACCFDGAEKLQKQIRKSRDLAALLDVDRRLFETCPLKAEPAFDPDEG